jgi:predicted RNA-binding protein YlqC (UPF0109 family)
MKLIIKNLVKFIVENIVKNVDDNNVRIIHLKYYSKSKNY